MLRNFLAPDWPERLGHCLPCRENSDLEKRTKDGRIQLGPLERWEAQNGGNSLSFPLSNGWAGRIAQLVKALAAKLFTNSIRVSSREPQRWKNHKAKKKKKTSPKLPSNLYTRLVESMHQPARPLTHKSK